MFPHQKTFNISKVCRNNDHVYSTVLQQCLKDLTCGQGRYLYYNSCEDIPLKPQTVNFMVPVRGESEDHTHQRTIHHNSGGHIVQYCNPIVNKNLAVIKSSS